MKVSEMSQDEKVTYMTTENIPKLILKMAIPTIISMLVTSFYNMADTIFVGRLNTQSTAAVGVSFSVMALIQACGFFFGHGSGNYISRALGARQYDDAEKMSATGFFSALFVGVIISITGIIFLDPISRLLGSTDTILPYTKDYLRSIFIGVPFIMGAFVLNNQLRFQGSASLAMIGIISGACVNVILDPILIFVLGFGVKGASMATAISQMISFIVLLTINIKKATIKVNIKKFSPSIYYYKHLFKGGIPSLCRQGMGSLSIIVVNTVAGNYGGAAADAAIAAVGVVHRISMFAMSALIGFGQGFQPVCGTNYGAKKYKRVKSAFYFCIVVGIVLLLIMSVLGFIFAPGIIRVFRDDEMVVTIGAVALRAQCIVFTVNAWNVMCNMMLQTMGIAFKASILAMARQGLFLVPAVLILPPLFEMFANNGLLGVQLSQAVSDVLSFLLAIPLGISGLRMLDEKNEIN